MKPFSTDEIFVLPTAVKG